MYKNIKFYIRLALLKQKLKKENKFMQLSDHLENKKYVLIVDDKIPEFKKDSGSRRLTEIIKLLLKNEIGVILMADFKEYRYASEYISVFKEMGVQVYEPSLDESGELLTKEKFLKKVLPHVNFAWLHRPEIFKKYEHLIRTENPSAKIFFDMVDFHYLRFKRQFDLNGDQEVLEKANKYLKMELDNCRKADKIIVISELEREALKEYYPDASKTVSIGNIHGQKKISPFPGFDERKNLLFIGGFDHTPNVDCVNYLHDEIMPLVWKVLPEVSIQILGSNAPKSVLSLNSERFKVVGYVDSVEPYFLKSRVFVAPLRYGAGIKGKIGQSLEYSLPLVTTNIGAEGFDFGTNRDLMVAETSEALANNIISLYQNQDNWNAISENAHNIIEPFSKETIEAKIMDLVK